MIKKENEILKQIIKDTIWMAVRYAHGRHTYAPDMVRKAMNQFKAICPDYKYIDTTITPSPPEKVKIIFNGVWRTLLINRLDHGYYLGDLLDK